MKPHLAFDVKNKLSNKPDAPDLRVDLNFKRLDDFNPDELAKQIPPLNELLELRSKLQDLKATLQPNDKLDELLMDAARDTEKRAELKKALGLDVDQGGSK
jgi:type VI secretion system protein ImpB